MRLEYLGYFVKVVELGSIASASNVLYISPQGISRVIQKIESELDVQLFERTGNLLRLTAEGQDVYETARAMLELEQKLRYKLDASSLASEHLQSITIFTTMQISATFLPKILSQFYKMHPATSVSLFELQPEDMTKKLQTDPVTKDAVLLFALPKHVYESLFSDRPKNFSIVELTRCPLMACVSTSSPLAAKSKITIQEFISSPLVTFNLDARLLTGAMEIKEKLPIIFNSSNITMCRTVLAANKDAIGITNSVTERYMKTPNLCAVPVEPTLDIVYCYLADRDGGRYAVQSFLELVEREFQ